ncbi:MAG: GGDEF domain-containing protein [Planctomycetota bacterium]
MSPSSNPSPSILCCDHRGEGLSVLLSGKAGEGFQIRETSDLRTTREALLGGRFDLILLHPLAEAGSVELTEIERLRGDAPPTPVLLVVEPGDPRSAINAASALEHGSFDLVHRDAAPEELVLRIERLLVETRSRAAIEELRHRALHDDRTDLLRPTAFEHRLAEHFSAAERHRLPLALVLIDLDGFGMVNKNYDHVVGDRVIARVGAAIRGALRAEDVAGRLGGDEFAVLLPYTGRIDAAHAVRRLRDEIRAQSRLVEGVPAGFRIRASLGFETFDGSNLASFAELRAHAEAALREAKRRGGDRGVYFRSLSRPG